MPRNQLARIAIVIVLTAIGSPWPANAQTKMEQDGKPTAAELEAQKLVPAYQKVADHSANKLIAHDADGFIATMDPALVKSIGAEKFKAMVERVFIPFFADYKKEGGELKICAARGSAGETGFSFYPEFVTSSGAIKRYVVTVINLNGKPTVSALLPDHSFEHDHPDVAKERTQGHP